MLKKTKIICTIGPSSEKISALEALLQNGMDIARLNFSHGNHEDMAEKIYHIKEAAKNCGRLVSLLLDTKGPEIRLGRFAGGKVLVKTGQKFTLAQADFPGTEAGASVSDKKLYMTVRAGDILLLADGLIRLQVEALQAEDIVTTVLNGGELSDLKRVSLPGKIRQLPFLSVEDEQDLLFGIAQNMDFVAASFVQSAADLKQLRAFIEQHDGNMGIIAKIECGAAVQNIDEIIAAADAVMVARGDLGVEILPENVPLVQKEIIQKCNKAGKPVIVATQMLESMTQNPRPTRAEASDVANAIFDGADAIMLSGETASGDYPVEAAAFMNSLALRTEKSLQYKELFLARGFHSLASTTDSLAHATVQIAEEINVAAIVTPTENGYTAQAVSRYRPRADIFAVAADEKTARKLNLSWGVHAIMGIKYDTMEEMVAKTVEHIRDKKLLKKDDLAIIASGISFGCHKNKTIQICTL